jgi:hypothetical protein
LIYDLAAAPANRSNIWWSSYRAKTPGDAFVPQPMVMVDSGNQVFAGTADYETFYKDMINASAMRDPQAVIHAAYEQKGQSIQFTIEVQNLSSQTLSSSTNSAAVHAFVYEAKPSGILASNILAAVSTPLQLLEPNQTATVTLQTSNLSGVNFTNLEYLVLVDYIPPGSKGAHDMLQAAKAIKK